MNKRFWLLTGLASLVIVSGCGSADEPKEKASKPPVEKKANESEDNSKTSKEAATTDETTKGDAPESNQEAENKDSNQAGSSEQKLTYEVDGKKIEQNAPRGNRDSLSINVLPNFELDKEEPGKYVVIDSKTGNMMRIEKASDESIGEIDANIKMRTKAVSEEIFHQETAGTDLDGAIHYKAYNGSDVVNVIYLPKQKAILTIFDQKNKENISPYVSMAKTINWK